MKKMFCVFVVGLSFIFFGSFFLKDALAAYSCNRRCSLDVNGCNVPLTCYLNKNCRDLGCVAQTDCVCPLTPTPPSTCPDTGIISANCSFAFSVNGIDVGTGNTNSGEITVETGKTLTITASQTIATAKVSLTSGSSAIVLFDGAKILLRKSVWMIDADADGYPASTTMTISATSPGATYRRKNALIEWWWADSNDSNALIHH